MSLFTTINKLNKSQKLSFRVSNLDNLMDGGLDLAQITEIYGESSTGKTQICLQLALNVQMEESQGGLNKKAIYIQTESLFPVKRLNQMIEELTAKDPKVNRDFLGNIFIKHVLNADVLVDVVTKELPVLFKNHQIGLLVIDSIAAIFRIETSDYNLRANKLRSIGHALMKLSKEYDCAVIIVNQATSFESEDGCSVTIPALGLAWSSLVNTRISITRNRIMNNLKRQLEIKYSPRLPSSKASFSITNYGLTD